MKCFMCLSSDGKLQMFENKINNDTVKGITCVLPDFLIPKSKKPIFICSTCQEQISFFHTIKKSSLHNCSRLKYFNAKLKGTNNVKCNGLGVVLNNDEVLIHRNLNLEFKVNPKSKYLLSSVEQDVKHIKEEDNENDHYSQQLVNDEASVNHLKDEESSCRSDDSTQHVNVGSFEFVDTNKFTEKDYNLPSNNSRHKDQPKTHYENQKKKYKCIDCHKAFTRPSELERHNRVHTGEKPYKCLTCQKTFSRFSTLNHHSLTHTNKKTLHEFKCTECHKAFLRRGELERHSLVHTGEKPYKCTTCQKTFTQLSNLNAHKLTHTGEKSHECDVCHKTFIRKSNLISHKRIHSNVQPYQCDVCNKGFTQSNNLSTHMLTHTGEKPHHCHLCEFKCTTAGNLKKHIRSHTGEKPYSCKHCEKSFTTTSHLKEHKCRHHSEDSK